MNAFTEFKNFQCALWSYGWQLNNATAVHRGTMVIMTYIFVREFTLHSDVLSFIADHPFQFSSHLCDTVKLQKLAT
jgi:hypothetical protein